ncbi:hypothetical protein KSD_77230 [Ktedonobacter sp. SOSP1-85]|uniref:alpha-L-rhamnosidase-related protein n=1 Tax=Ktedonobacter sp. SOSP1-85 TaxID=2778367 RepID=UPI001915DCDC|nr:hypothetical protein [Ktedonobacter sp. SOSP1-85]GHO79952.1 hypothetical protein KSD_77230 [Ktedonobacter sp. SOSP1-85]
MQKPHSTSPLSLATWQAYGYLTTDAHRYRPLDVVTVSVHGRQQGDDRALIRVCDSDQQIYFEAAIDLHENHGEVSFIVAGALGVHYIYLTWPGGKRHSRYLNFLLDCATGIKCADEDFAGIYPRTKELMLLGRREYRFPMGKFVGYISADTWHFDGIWLRDWIYGLPAYKYWEQDMSCGLDHFLDAQSADGMVPDGIERDGKTWRVGMESDVEYILTLGIWQTWLVTGDNAWLRRRLPQLERALHYIQQDPRHWDEQHRLVKRQHSCDTWDFDIDGVSDSGENRHVIATCDQSGYYQAFCAMSQMYRSLGEDERALSWAEKAEAYRQRALALLWDGLKFLHHVHLSPIDHGDFDESQQLAMGNTWAITRGLADRSHAQSIIDEYRRRHAETGDAYPWWSLQPGYPDELGYFSQPYCKQGGYANGGLMPWVGGELCLGAFLNGRTHYAVELLRQYAEHLRRTDGAHVWYWPDGEVGYRTPNEVPYASWGLAQWANALMEGLAGLQDREGLWRHVSLSPRWALTGVQEVYVCARYDCNQAYFAYRMSIDYSAQRLTLDYSGSGQDVLFQVLVPPEWSPATVTLNDQAVTFERLQDEDGLYLVFDGKMKGAGHICLMP